MLRAVVEEREYAVVARIGARDENGEEIPKSDRIAAAYRICEKARNSSKFPAEVVEDERGVVALVHLGDAPDADFEEAAGTLLEAASW